MLMNIGECRHPNGQMLMFGPSAALAAIGREIAGSDAHRCACMTAITIRAVGENAATTEAILYQFGVDISVD